MAKDITYSDNCRQMILRGVNKLARAVKVTLGPVAGLRYPALCGLWFKSKFLLIISPLKLLSNPQHPTPAIQMSVGATVLPGLNAILTSLLPVDEFSSSIIPHAEVGEERRKPFEGCDVPTPRRFCTLSQ